MLSRVGLWVRLQAAVQASRLRSPQRQPKKIVFIVGTGRSGTHFLTRCLIGHEEISDVTGGKENPLVFETITAAALDQSRAEALLPRATKVYDALASMVAPGWFLDQSHPNLWFAEHWAEIYPSSRFIGIIRNPYSVVASMMKHEGVRSWVLRWQSFPVPNAFLGITQENAALYAQMSIAERCTLRWISHYGRLHELRDTLGHKLSIIRYEDLCRDSGETLAGLARELQLAPEFPPPEVDVAALTRGADMTAEDVAAIERLLAQAQVEDQWRLPAW